MWMVNRRNEKDQMLRANIGNFIEKREGQELKMAKNERDQGTSPSISRHDSSHVCFTCSSSKSVNHDITFGNFDISAV